jgi:hypothetical protein
MPSHLVEQRAAIHTQHFRRRLPVAAMEIQSQADDLALGYRQGLPEGEGVAPIEERA